MYVKLYFWPKYPRKPKVVNLSLKQIQNLHNNIKIVLLKAIKEGGTSIQDHKNVSGEIGYFQNYLSVYNREKKSATPMIVKSIL